MSYNVLKKYDHGGVHPDIKELLSVMDKMSSSPRTDRRATFEDSSVEEVSPSSFDKEFKARTYYQSNKDYSDQEANARDFMQLWMNSKRGREMLKKSYGDDWESAFVDRHRNTQQTSIAHVSSFPTMKKNLETSKLEPRDEIVGSTWKEGDAYSLTGPGVKGRPSVMGPASLRNRGLVRVADYNYPGDKALIHELSHAGDAMYDKSSTGNYMRTRNIPISDVELMEALSNRDQIIQDEGPRSYKAYLSKPTETRARLSALRSKADDQGYDIFNEGFTEDMLNQVYPGRVTYSLKDESFYKQLREIYDDKEILDLLNNIS